MVTYLFYWIRSISVRCNYPNYWVTAWLFVSSTGLWSLQKMMPCLSCTPVTSIPTKDLQSGLLGNIHWESKWKLIGKKLGLEGGSCRSHIYAEENKELGANGEDYALEDWLIWSVGGRESVRKAGLEHEVTGNAHIKVIFVGWVHYLRHTRYPCTLLFIKVGRKKKHTIKQLIFIYRDAKQRI